MVICPCGLRYFPIPEDFDIPDQEDSPTFLSKVAQACAKLRVSSPSPPKDPVFRTSDTSEYAEDDITVFQRIHVSIPTIGSVILGQFPIFLYALAYYKRRLGAARDGWRYRLEFDEFYIHLCVEQECFNDTLRKLGIANPSKRDFEEHLQLFSPEQANVARITVRRMESILADLMDKFDVDSTGKVSGIPL